MLCPRSCGANRALGSRGVCGANDTLQVARAALHFWEEPPISGEAGSGTVFFSNCPLHCVYCQNNKISSGNVGKVISRERLAEIFFELEAKGAVNINLVSPTHYVPQIIAAIDAARADGFALPFVYNTGGYETVETIVSLEGYIDIYLSDLKYTSVELSSRYSGAPDYFEKAALALEEMVEQVGSYSLEKGVGTSPDLLKKGVIVRHLMLPGQLEDSKAVVRHVWGRYGDDICLSLMNQYTPCADSARFPELTSTVSEAEYSALIDYALDLGVGNSFMQEGGTATESFIPAFDNEGV
ncbi:MAG: 4Fe-4S cluster-binding domain-containing protein [Actinobacteria bacterium]|nr:4Fe-4S cluster-binding domain-containing protein [Actinomycetota bacterium]